MRVAEPKNPSDLHDLLRFYVAEPHPQSCHRADGPQHWQTEAERRRLRSKDYTLLTAAQPSQQTSPCQ